MQSSQAQAAIAVDALQACQAQQAQALAQACKSLWLATLQLMTAYMHNGAPAHRYLLAKRIAHNFATLREQECFGAATQKHFAKLARRWQHTAEDLSPAGPAPAGVFMRLQRLITR